jgi:hypothetical protein
MKTRRLTSISFLLVLLATVVSASAIDPDHFDRNYSRYFWTRDYYMDNAGKVHHRSPWTEAGSPGTVTPATLDS